MQIKMWKMNTVDRQRIGSLLREKASSMRLSQAEIAKKTGMSQSQVSRILAGRFNRLSKKVMQICKFLEVQSSVSITTSHLSKRLSDAVLAAWDGTKAHEDALVRLLSALRGAMKP